MHGAQPCTLVDSNALLRLVVSQSYGTLTVCGLAVTGGLTKQLHRAGKALKMQSLHLACVAC
jgi:hypothetical protein